MSHALRVAAVVLGLVALPAVAFVAAKSQPSHGPPPPAAQAHHQQPQQQTEPSLPI